MGQLPPKSQILKRKNQTIFVTQIPSKKTKFVKFGVKKANLATLVTELVSR